jgi:hypothetical protein
LQKFERQSTKNNQITFPVDRADRDIDDSDSLQNAPPPEEEDADINPDSDKAPAPHPLRTWAYDGGDDDYDCIMLEVYDRMPISYAYPMDLASADPDAQVVENAVPLAAQATSKRGAKRSAATGTSSGASPVKKRKKDSAPKGPQRRPKGPLAGTKSPPTAFGKDFIRGR